jgi:outer membrane protein assembly factor BamB
VGTEGKLLRLAPDLGIVAGVDISGGVIDLAYDEPRDTVYAISPDGLYAFDQDLVGLSDVSDFYGDPSSLALGKGAVLVGTDAGILYAYSYAMSHAGSPPMMVAGWRYPRSGALVGRITSLVPDPRGTGTTYVTTSAGKAYAVSLSGEMLWSYPAVEGETVAPILSTPVVDERSGRLFFGDDSGLPYVLESDGSLSFSVDVSATGGAAIRSSLVVDERREETAKGRVLIRTYYYGTEDGWIYRIDSLK